MVILLLFGCKGEGKEEYNYLETLTKDLLARGDLREDKTIVMLQISIHENNFPSSIGNIAVLAGNFVSSAITTF